MGCIIETKDLTKVYDKTTVVDHLNLRVNEGEVYGLLGPNGAGKTTTILMLMGLTEPTSGTATVCEFNSTREPLKVKRIVGYMPEKVGFYENMTSKENLQLIARLNGIPDSESEAAIPEILKSVGLGKIGNLTVGKFSRGMKQRLGIADVLIKKPRVAIMDEPTAGLDPEGINHILELIGGLPKLGTTVVMCSHRLYEVQRICQSIGILSKGKMIVQGSLDQLGRQALTNGRYQIELKTVEPGSQVAEIVKKVKGVLKVDVKDGTLLISSDSDLRVEISRAVVQNNFTLTEMKIQEFNLDDIYMKYFNEG
ncbi:MAG: ABC transporter ATP-binding protein [Chloroflexi bacterium]|nr:ABC transporter ATP-binding protein [Chloroflexota bacterium]